MHKSFFKRTFSWLSITPFGASVVPDYIICMGKRCIRVMGRMKGGVRVRSERKKRGGNEKDNGGKEEGEFSISILQVSAAVTHSVNKHSTMV